jgi:hypothetical protein
MNLKRLRLLRHTGHSRQGCGRRIVIVLLLLLLWFAIP